MKAFHKQVCLFLLALVLSGCQSMTPIIENGVEVGKQPTSLVAVERARGAVNECVRDMVTLNASVPISTGNEAARWHSFVMMQQMQRGVAECYNILAVVAEQFNLTDRQRLQLGMVITRASAGIVGGYIAAEEIAGIASSAGTRVSIENNGHTGSSSPSAGAVASGTPGELGGVASNGGAATGGGISGNQTFSVNVNSQVQQATEGASVLTPNLEYATDLGYTSPIVETTDFRPSTNRTGTTIGDF